MHAIKILLVLGVLLIAVWAFRNRGHVGVRAGARVLMLVLTGLAIASIIDTRIPQKAADLLGVTRGTDLILYLLVLVYALTTTGQYFRSRYLDRRITALVRAGAIREAVLADGLPGEAPDEDPAGADAGGHAG